MSNVNCLLAVILTMRQGMWLQIVLTWSVHSFTIFTSVSCMAPWLVLIV